MVLVPSPERTQRSVRKSFTNNNTTMNRIDKIMNYLLIVCLLAIAVGYYGAFFFNWKWHEPIMGTMALYLAIVGLREMLSNKE